MLHDAENPGSLPLVGKLSHAEVKRMAAVCDVEAGGTSSFMGDQDDRWFRCFRADRTSTTH